MSLFQDFQAGYVNAKAEIEAKSIKPPVTPPVTQTVKKPHPLTIVGGLLLLAVIGVRVIGPHLPSFSSAASETAPVAVAKTVPTPVAVPVPPPPPPKPACMTQKEADAEVMRLMMRNGGDSMRANSEMIAESIYHNWTFCPGVRT